MQPGQIYIVNPTSNKILDCFKPANVTYASCQCYKQEEQASGQDPPAH